MKMLLKIPPFLLAMFLTLAISCKSAGTKQEKPVNSASVSLIEVSVTGMTCAGCENTVQTSVAKIEGVKSVKATAANGKAIVEYTTLTIDTSLIRKAIVASGYGVTGFNMAVANDSTIK